MKTWHRNMMAGFAVLAIASGAAYGAAQTKPGDAGAAARKDGHGPHGEHEGVACDHDMKGCPVRELARMAEVKVDKTTTGATLTFTTKGATKVAELQALVEKLAQHVKTGECAHAEGGHPEGHGPHGHK